MGKNKLRKFAEMQTFGCVFQYPFARLDAEGFPMRGLWREEYFHSDAPIVLELGCGKGEYTVGLARTDAGKNYVGIDIKGARIWSGAKQAEQEGMANVAFLRTDIELIDRFFAPGEVDEIWITFPDPQMQKCRKRLTSTRFMHLYRRILKPGGTIHLKTDSPFLYEYTRRMAETNGLAISDNTADLYAEDPQNPAAGIQTFYERQWLARGKKIKLLSFSLHAEPEPLEEPYADDIERDDYHSLPRGIVQRMPDQIEKFNTPDEGQQL